MITSCTKKKNIFRINVRIYFLNFVISIVDDDALDKNRPNCIQTSHSVKITNYIRIRVTLINVFGTH
jgi:hypothetical protein